MITPTAKTRTTVTFPAGSGMVASEIVSVPGVRFAGAIPAALQSYIVFAAAMGPQASNSDAVMGLMAWISNVELDPLLRAKGMEMP